jgi:arylformamidase
MIVIAGEGVSAVLWTDITLPVREEYPAWPGDRPFQRRVDAVIGEGSDCNLSSISCSVHFGTHLDAPYHFIAGGRSVEQLDLGLLIGDCLVVEVAREAGIIEVADLQGLVPAGTLRLLVKTINSLRVNDRVFHTDYLAFSPKAVTWLLEQGVRLLGLDYYSIGPFGDVGETVHQIFFRDHQTIAVEGIDLGLVSPGEYQLICLPMKLVGADGAPCRLVLGTGA